MQDTKRINHVEASRAERQMEQVGLHDVRVLQMAGIVKRSIYCWTDVYSDDLARVLRGEKQMAALAAACVKQDLAAKTIRRMRSEVPAEVGLALRAEIGEVPPFVTEATHRAQIAFLFGTLLDCQAFI